MHNAQFFMRRYGLWVLVLGLSCAYLLFGSRAVTNASDSATVCPSIVTTALNSTTSDCGSTRRNQLCYGHNLVRVEPQAFASQLGFVLPGDTIPVSQVRSVRGSPLDINNASWGVALMRIQAGLPDGLPDQNATFLLFGDTEITDATTHDLSTLSTTTNTSINMRSGPAASYPVLASVPKGTSVIANGRLPDSSWLRVWLPQQEGSMGWVLASLISTASGDVNTLKVIDPSQGTPGLGPLQAFYLTTSDSTLSGCQQLPASGLLIQTPEGAGTIRLYINEVKFDIGSTVFFQAQANGDMTVSTLEGMAVVEAANHTEVAAAGSQIRVPLGDHLSPAGPPTMPQPYDPTRLQSLPIAELERPIVIAPPLSTQSIDDIHQRVQTHQPLCGVGSLRSCNSLMLEGAIQAMDADTITVNNMLVVVAPRDPIRKMLTLGTLVHIEGNLEPNGTRIIPTKIIVLAPVAPGAPGATGGPASPPGGMGDPAMGMGDPAMGMGDPAMGMGSDGMGNGMGPP